MGDTCFRPLPECGILYLAATARQAMATLRKTLAHAGLSARESHQGILTAPFTLGGLHQLASLCQSLSHEDLNQTYYTMVATDATPTMAELMQSERLSNLINHVEGNWLLGVLRGGKLVIHLQPIVSIQDPQRVVACECLLRCQQDDGKLIGPDRLFAAARAANALASLDQTAQLTAIETVARRRLQGDIFVNFFPGTIADVGKHLDRMLLAMRMSGLQPERFVFEVVESDVITDIDQLLVTLEKFRDRGLRLALDDLGKGGNSLTMLSRVRPQFIKLDVDLIRGVDQDPYKARVASKILELARDLGVTSVVEGIETPAEWQWALDHGAELGQGYLFARPAAEVQESQFSGRFLGMDQTGMLESSSVEIPAVIAYR